MPAWKGPGPRPLLTQSRSHLASQEQVTAAVAHAVEQQMQKLLEETQLDMNEFDNLLQPIIDTCTKDAISVRTGEAFPELATPFWGQGYSKGILSPFPTFPSGALPWASSNQERDRRWAEVTGFAHIFSPGRPGPSYPLPRLCRPGRTGCSATPSPRPTAS